MEQHLGTKENLNADSGLKQESEQSLAVDWKNGMEWEQESGSDTEEDTNQEIEEDPEHESDTASA